MTFFSGTDQATLKEEGLKRNHFVSLIVNNAGEYVARITRKLTVHQDIIESSSYHTFDNIEKVLDKTTDVKDIQVIEYADLEIDKRGIINNFKDIDDRLNSIKEAKATMPKANPNNWIDSKTGDPIRIPEYKNSLFKNELPYYKNTWKEEEEELIGNITFSKELIKSYVIKLITSSVALRDDSKIDPVKWASGMNNVFDKAFKTVEDYEVWAETFVEYLLVLSTDHETSQFYDSLAQKLIKELEKLPKNKYIDILITTLSYYLI